MAHKGYDSDPLNAALAAAGTEMIAPNRAPRRQMTQDARPCGVIAPAGSSSAR